MNNLEIMVDDALRDPLAAAREFAGAGGRVMAYVGAEVPVELILASGAFALRLPSSVQDTPRADQFLESTFPADIRSIAEQYLQGGLGFVDTIVLPRSNDSAQRLYYYLCELRARGLATGPQPLIFDLAKIPRESSRAHSRRATARLADELGAGPDALQDAIVRRNRRRELFGRVAQCRLGAPASGSQMERILRAADVCDADAFDASLTAWLDHAASVAPTAGPRLLLLGSAPPDESIHRAVESAGGNVVAEWGAHASGSVSAPIIPPSGTLHDIADHYQMLVAGSRAFVDRATATSRLAGEARVDAVVIWLVEQEEALIWDLPAQRVALATAKIPCLALSRRRWDLTDGALDEIGAFTRQLSRTS